MGVELSQNVFIPFSKFLCSDIQNPHSFFLNQ